MEESERTLTSRGCQLDGERQAIQAGAQISTMAVAFFPV